jgi:hypothetical protein
MKPGAALAISLAIAFAMLLSAGCITESKELGCCVRNNATKDGKCYWFNMSNDAFVDMYPQTVYCNQTSELCNVSIDQGGPVEIPFCTDDNITECIKPDCLAMACGDFTYAPQVAPGIASAQDAANEVPASSTSTTTEALYDGQCRFLPMDSNFEQIMKTSKSEVGDFRFGVGADFDEYDYYHYYFPISDRYCMINPTGTIDRYMNYLQPGSTPGTYVAYDPTKMTATCTSDAAPVPPASIAPAPSILPLSASATNALESITIQKALSLNPGFIVDDNSYKYVDYLGYAWSPKEQVSDTGEITSVQQPTSLGDLVDNADYYYEKLDDGFYRKALSTAYIPEFYNTTVGRAPFECDTSADECLSGDCSTDFYSRGVNLVTDVDGTETYVATDCKDAQTVTGQSIVVCYPTINASNAGGTASFVYANVTYRPWQLTLATEDYNAGDLQDDDTQHSGLDSNGNPDCLTTSNQNKCQLDWLWDNFFTATTQYFHWRYPSTSGPGVPFYNTATGDELFGEPVTVSLLPANFSIGWNGTNVGWEQTDANSSVDSTGAYPPAGQIVFFDDQNVQYDGDTIVGYAVADPGQFEQTYFAKSCIFDTQTTYRNYTYTPEPELGIGISVVDCQVDCDKTCSNGAVDPACVSYCRAYVNVTDPNNPTLNSPEPPAPCNYPVTEQPDENSYIKVDLSGTGQDFYTNYQNLMTAFGPVYNGTIASYASSPDWNNKCNPWNGVDIDDLFFASMPWIPEYKKVFDTDYGLVPLGSPTMSISPPIEDDILNGPALNFFRDQDNIYEQPTSSSPYFAGNTLCNLQKASAKTVGAGRGADILDWAPITYQALVPETVYLLVGTKDSEGNMKVGRCDIEEGSTLPQIQSFGWCEPCTLTTLAYQKITTGTSSVTQDNVMAFPATEQELKPGASPTTICTIAKNMTTSCGDPYVTDIGDYSNLLLYHTQTTSSYVQNGIGAPSLSQNTTTVYTSDGVPRTDQDPALVKERMGNYLKSGIMPVIDISDESDWNLTAPYMTEEFTNATGVNTDTSQSTSQNSTLYDEYDFQPLLGNSGAIVVIVDTFNSSSPSFSRDEILNRTAVIRASCPRCLTAVRVPGSSVGLSTYDDDLGELFGVDPRVGINVDMIVTDYDPADYTTVEAPAASGIGALAQSVIYTVYTSPSTSTDTRVSLILTDMESYGEDSLNYSKPVMITDFGVTNDLYWSFLSYPQLFDSIVNNEDQLMKSGIIGIIYQPVRSDFNSNSGVSLVNETTYLAPYGFSGSLDAVLEGGVKTQKFCALENSINRMAGTNPYATFVQVYTVPSVNCTQCTSLELAQGECSKTCDDGVQCTMPSGVPQEDIGDYKCPDETVVEPCTPCSETNMVYSCTQTFGNGTQTQEPAIKSANIVSDAYEDVMAGMSKPDKCCLTDSTGANYTYFKQMYYTSVTAPAVFSRTGNPAQDCGIGTGDSLTQLGAFCGVNLPVQNYDINCTGSPS